eukprot:4004324-Pleurochrysis_carterae.AAC.1
MLEKCGFESRKYGNRRCEGGAEGRESGNRGPGRSAEQSISRQKLATKVQQRGAACAAHTAPLAPALASNVHIKRTLYKYPCRQELFFGRGRDAPLHR